MYPPIFHIRRSVISYGVEAMLRISAWRLSRKTVDALPPIVNSALSPGNPSVPEDFHPLEAACFQDPYAFYKMLRDDYPVYQLPNGIYCVSRFADIVAVSRDHENYSSTYQGIIAGIKQGRSIQKVGQKMDAMSEMGVIPSNVLALSDPPVHSSERKVGHKALNSRYVKSLEPVVEALVNKMMDEFIPKGRVEFMQEFGWRLPMKLIIELLGFPAQDFEKIKGWCVHGVASLSGISTPPELMQSRAASIAFQRYCWKEFLKAKKAPRNDLCQVFVAAAEDPDNPMTEQVAVSAIFQLLIAGSDSSATSMGNALKMLIENPKIAAEIRGDMDKLPAFVEEVFRLEAAFQGHFRWTKEDCDLHGMSLPEGSRVFLMWASGNRDDRVFDNPDSIDLNRKNGKKHLTFGHGIHACIGRELARTEIRIVLREFLLRTENLRLEGDAPFMASMFARTLLRLPVAFDPVKQASEKADKFSDVA